MAEPAPGEKDSLQRHMLRGWLWTVGYRWIIRLTGLINTVILARLLTPADYGIVAIAMLIVGTIETFSNTGQYAAIIRHPNPTREHYDSVWTISLLLGLGLGVIILAATPLTTAYFHEPRATLVVEILAMRTVFLGFQNVGVVNFQRHLEFHKQFRFNVYPTLFSFLVTLASAVILRNYWALVIGIMAKQGSIVVLSYTMQPFRPRLSLAKVREIWSFSIWTLLKSIGIYISTQVDKVSIGSFGGAAAVGRYDVGQDLASSPSQELVTPIVTVLFPVMSVAQHNTDKRRSLYLSVLYYSALICASTSVGVALVASDLVDLVLGPQWVDLKPLLPWLALSYGVLGLSSSVYSAFETMGRPMMAARLQWLCVLVLWSVIFPVGYYFRDLQAVAAARFVVSVALVPLLFYSLSSALDVRLRDFALTLWRPILSGLCMAVAVTSANAIIPFSGTPRLAIDVSLGILGYIGSALALWFFAGRPEGPERLVWAGLLKSIAALSRNRLPPNNAA